MSAFKPISSKVPRLYQWFLFGLFALSWFSGLSFFILDEFVRIEGEFGPQRHSAQQPALSIHGASAFGLMMLIGAIALNHIPLSWRMKRLRFIGIALASAIALQILTAYTLYYTSDEQYREIAKYVHLGMGSALPILLAWHVLAARKKK